MARAAAPYHYEGTNFVLGALFVNAQVLLWVWPQSISWKIEHYSDWVALFGVQHLEALVNLFQFEFVGYGF